MCVCLFVSVFDMCCFMFCRAEKMDTSAEPAAESGEKPENQTDDTPVQAATE